MELHRRALVDEVGAVLEDFDETSGLQRIADLAAAQFADWAYVHLKVDAAVATVAIGHRDPVALAAARALATAHPAIAPDTATGRVLAGGAAELLAIDERALASATDDAAHLAQLRTTGYHSGVVAPLRARGGVIGAIALARTHASPPFAADDLPVVTELGRRIAIAVENARLFRAERAARDRAERAHDRASRLQALASELSTALDQADVMARVVLAGRAAVGAPAAFAWALREDEAVLELVAHADAGGLARVDDFHRFPLAARIPVCEVVRTGATLVFETYTAMREAFPDTPDRDQVPYHAWAVIPFVAGGRAIGAATFSFDRDRGFSLDRELLAAMIGQAALALERCRLLADIDTARRRERELAALAAKLSRGLTAAEVARTVADEAARALGARLGSTMIADGDAALRLARSGPLVDARPDRLALADATPSTDAIRTGEVVWCASVDDIRARYPDLEALRAANGLAAWGAMPFDFEGRTVGALAIGFTAPRTLRDDEREFLVAAGRLAAQALERARLYDELRKKDERLRAALHAGRAGTWSVDVRTMTSQRDPSFAALLGLPADIVIAADFSTTHPDDSEVARAAFLRTLAEGVPYEPEVRMRCGDGSYMWTRSYAQLVYDDRGPTHLTGVTFDIDELKRASLERERAYAAAREADQRKDEFLAMLGHELRNPLAPIATALELMRGKLGDAAAKERAVIERQVGHLRRLIDDLLDVSRITRGKVMLERAPIELAAVLAKAIEMASPLLEKRAHELRVDVAPAGFVVDADATRLAQVFQNLLTNAAKYTPDGGRIEVRARRAGGDVVVDVHDNGIGIAPALLPHLFELFRQGERALDRADGGLGIGLTVARSLCELHGGSIAARSDGADRGSTFTVRLPLAPAAVEAPPQPTVSAVRRAVRALRVLIVDDNVDAAVMLHEYLAMLGHDSAVAHDGPSALALAPKHAPELAVLDIGLPVMDGYELARRLRAQLGTGVRLVAVTGYGQDSDRERAKAAGFDHHLVKPLRIEQLTALLDD